MYNKLLDHKLAEAMWFWRRSGRPRLWSRRPAVSCRRKQRRPLAGAAWV